MPRNFINKDDFLNNLYASSDLYEWFFSVIIENINPPNIKIIRKKNINLIKPYISSKNNSFYDFFNSFKNLENVLKPHRYILYFLKCVSGIFPDRIKTFNNVYGVGPFQSLLFSLIINFRSVYSKNKPIAKNEHISEEDLSQNPVSIELPDDLMSLIDKVILELLPEEYGIKKFNEKIHKISSNKFKKNRLRIDFTSMGDSDKSFFQAMAQEKGERLYYCQHGSNYMTQKKHWGLNFMEAHGEGFIKWGEEDLPGYNNLKFVTVSSPSFSKIANKHKYSRSEIIFVGTIYYVLFNGIFYNEPSCFFDYINAKHRFLSILSSDVMEKMWYRPWVHKEYWNNFDDFEFVNHYFPSIRELSGNLKKRMLACKILVLDHYGTCFYEAMASNTPVMMYYAHPQATKHPQADLMFSKLKSIGIIHDTPDSAAKMINEIWPDVKTWWQSKDVQNLRNEFCTKYALTNKFWRLEWAKMVWNQ